MTTGEIINPELFENKDQQGWAMLRREDLRDDILLVGYARSKGWTANLGKDEKLLDADGFLPTYREGGKIHLQCSGDSYSFKRGDQELWFSDYNSPRWKISDGNGNKHCQFQCLKDALDILPSKEMI